MAEEGNPQAWQRRARDIPIIERVARVSVATPGTAITAYRLRSYGLQFRWALRTDLLRTQAQLHAEACDKLARRANQQKPVQPFSQKIFCFRSHPNHAHNSARLAADEGRWPSSRTCGEMRWTREPRLTCVAQTYGEVVWFGRRGAGAKSGRSEASRGRRRQKSRSPGRARSKP